VAKVKLVFSVPDDCELEPASLLVVVVAKATIVVGVGPHAHDVCGMGSLLVVFQRYCTQAGEAESVLEGKWSS
jgi:hypothetical protein